MGAVALKSPRIALTEEQSAELANAMQEVAKHYTIKALDEKTIAWITLVFVTAGIYGPMVNDILAERKKRAALEAAARGPMVARPAAFTPPAPVVNGHASDPSGFGDFVPTADPLNRPAPGYAPSNFSEPPED